MNKFFESLLDNEFTWESIGDIVEGRRNLGENMPVFVYRLFQYTIKDILTKKYGNSEAKAIFKSSGEIAGREFANHMLDLTLPLSDFISSLKDILEESKIGILRVESFDEDSGNAVLTVGEDLDCSGLPITGDTVCDYDEGFLEGILKVYTNKNYYVKEVDCWATGSRVCRFEANVLDEE